VINKRLVLRALDLYVAANVDFGDAYLIATMGKFGSEAIYSYDAHYERVKGITRKEP
jgi:predicted nucleic acid-binding protein